VLDTAKRRARVQSLTKRGLAKPRAHIRKEGHAVVALANFAADARVMTAWRLWARREFQFKKHGGLLWETNLFSLSAC
jgi:hypothetical protein